MQHIKIGGGGSQAGTSFLLHRGLMNSALLEMSVITMITGTH